MRFYLVGRVYDWFIEPLVRRLKEKVASYVQTHDLFPALDICCGTGTQCQILGNKNPDVYGLDIDLSMVGYASEKYPQRKFICADAIHVPFKDHSFKGVLISFSLHDKTSEIQEKIWDEIQRLLDPEGAVVFVDFENPWNMGSRVGSVFSFMIERIAGGEHFKNNRRFLEEGGLRAFIQRHRLVEIERFNIEMGSIAVVMARRN